MMLSLSNTRLARRLVEHNAAIIKSGSDAFPAYPRGDRRKRPICWVSQDSFKVLSSFGGIERQDNGYVVAQSFAKRCQVGGDFSNQHRSMQERDVFISSGVRRTAGINRSLSALDRLYRRKNIEGKSY